ncbi:uncharacterized protein LOC122664848 isoform X4 [Telopea speciosissima]|uniref:uncharacterized protein LOC122664848 isoform X4 n=1 Tax=Telopea speciosissima TaxID=54955 RepID=UPI001CC68E15|nr:uncharacterized protein LOC122664848 isoform X4 [Telopea speciosissima]
MGIEKSPEWLPPGWIRETKERSDGKTDSYYINLKTGEKCRSKIEVARHTKSGNLCNRMPQQIKRCTRDNENQVVQMEDVPKWLPTDWSMVVQTRKSGNRVGQKYKCYIAPITGFKLYSKRQVFSYLKTGKRRSRASEPNERDIGMHSTESARKVVVEKHTEEVFPLGWIKEIKVTELASEPSGRDIKMHSTKSASKVVVEEHTEEGLPPGWIKEIKVTQLASEPNERDIGMHSTESASKVVVEKHTEEGLPPGWIKEIKVTQLAYRIRKDPYYIDSVTGYEFRSKKDVFRYLESGDIRRCKIRPKKRQISGMESIDGEIFPHTAEKRHKIEGNATRRSLFTGQSSKSSKAVEDELVLESSVVEECLPLSSAALDGENSQMLSEAHQESEGIKNVECKLVCAENGFMSAPGAEVSPERESMEKLHSADKESSKLISGAQESGGLGNMVCAERSLISDHAADMYPVKQPSEKPHDAYGESSRLISAAQESRGLENTEEKMVCVEKGIISAPAAKISPEKQPSEKPHSVNRESSELFSVAQQESEGLVHAENGFNSAPSARVSPKKQLSEKSLGKNKKRAQLCTSNSQDGKELPVPRRASKRLAGLRAELAPNLEMSERSLGMVAKQSVDLEANPAIGVNPSSCNLQASMQVVPPEAAARVATTPYTSRGSGVLLDGNSSKEGDKPPGDQAVMEDLIGKLESEKQSTEKPESPFVLPFGDSWPDPCLEFAFKTLTGAIPVDDNLVIGEYFQPNLSVGQDQSRSSFTLPDLGLDGPRQTDSMFQFGTAEKPTAKQQSPGKVKS